MRIVNIFLSVLVVCLLGCNGQNAAEEAVFEQKEKSLLQREKEVAAYEAGYRKPGASVRVVNKSVPHLMPGQVKTVELILQTGYTEGVMSIEVSSTEGLEIIGASQVVKYALEKEADYPLRLDLMANNAGRYYLNLNILVAMPEGAEVARVMSYAIQVGDEGTSVLQQKIDTNQPGNESKDKIISMPAEEVVY